MHSCSIIMAAGSHGSTYNGGVRPRSMTDLSPTRSTGNNDMSEAWEETSVITRADFRMTWQAKRYVDSQVYL